MSRLAPIVWAAAAALAASPATTGTLEKRVDALFAAYSGKTAPGCAVGLFERETP